MGKTLKEIAEQLSTPQVIKKTITKETKQIQPREVSETKPVPKVQLIYAFNGTGKTRLSRELKKLICPKLDEVESIDDVEEIDAIGETRKKILYYSAFTEDLFYWDNDLQYDADTKLKIQPNSFTDWILGVQGKGDAIISKFHHYTNDKLMPLFVEREKEAYQDGKKVLVKTYPEVTFSYKRGDNTETGKIKISKGEESNFVWSIFFTLLEQVVSILNTAEPSERETDEFNSLEYIFIDDPVSSLDENHLIELAVSLADLIKAAPAELKFIITTHNTLFFNVMYNELNSKTCYILDRHEDGTFSLTEKSGDSNKSFSYHLYLKQTLEQAIANNQVERYHFTLLRNLYEKTANFLGYDKWSELLPDDKMTYYNRVIQFTSHSTLSNETVADPSPQEKRTIKVLLDHLVEKKYADAVAGGDKNAGA